jgi:hypothetical protein
MKPLRICSWYLARAIGVTRTPPDGAEFIEVKVEGGPPLFWPLVKRFERTAP